MKGYRLSIIRHGLTDANDKAIYLGSRTDYSLSKKGISQIVNKMDEYEYPKVQRVYSSPMKRCIETAEIIYPYRISLEFSGVLSKGTIWSLMSGQSA